MGIRSNIRRHPSAWAGGALVAIALAVFVVVWFEPQQLFIDKTVDEALPTAPALTAPAVTTAPGPTSAPADTTAPAAPTDATLPSPASPDPTEAVTTPPPATPAAPLKVLARGGFRGLEHESTGTAKLLRLPNGELYLRFEDLDTSNGPDLVVYLSPRPASDDLHGWDQGDFLDLGSLKGNVGDQNYLLPTDTDPSKYASAVIWCRRFKVGFAVAPLVQSPV